MSIEAPTSDADLLDLFRVAGPLGVSELAEAVEVTATAIRQRLTRLLAQGIIERRAIRAGRGRPRHLYRLTEKGLRLTGSNFADLASALWRELGSIEDQQRRQAIIQRVAKALAAKYRNQLQGDTPAERMRCLGKLFNQWRIPVVVDDSPLGVTLTARACPYPDLADQDCSVCAMEKALFSELVGREVELVQCRLQGAAECRFQIG